MSYSPRQSLLDQRGHTDSIRLEESLNADAFFEVIRPEIFGMNVGDV
jgi:hypothetical protein